MKRRTGGAALGAALMLLGSPLRAQELTPRAYWPAPKGTKVAIVGFAHSFGSVVTDPSLPASGVDSNLNNFQLAYLQTLNLGGRTSNLIVELPYTWGSTSGTLLGASRTREVSAFGDAAVTLSINLLGAPTMSPADFQELRKNPHPILGVSLKVIAPTGGYEEDRLINVGANRWSARTEVGLIIPLRPRWLLELEGAAWLFGDNDEFLGGTREQDPILSAEIHLVRRFRPGFWASVQLNHFVGGGTTVDGVRRADTQRNSRLGFDLLYSFRGPHSIKLGLSTGISTESGGDYNTVLMAYQVLLRKRKPRG